MRKASEVNFENLQSEVEDLETSPPRYSLNTYPADFTLEVLWQKWKNKEIEVPEFQRQFVWNQPQASKLIESFLLELPVPPVYFYADKRSQNLLVVDGQQRLKSVFYFLEGIWQPTKKQFELVGLHPESPYAGKTFSQLEAEDLAEAKRLKNAGLRSFVVKQVDPEDKTSIYHIFERLNTGGTPLRGQEIRNCVYSGSFNNLLVNLNKDAAWRTIVGKSEPDRRMRDVELILRFLALTWERKRYTKPMNEFLNNFMIIHRSAGPRQLRLFERAFRSTAEIVSAALGQRPFHIKSGLNVAACDSVMVGIRSKRLGASDTLRARYQKVLLRNSAYLNAIRKSTTDETTVRDRIRIAQRVLAGGQ